MSELARGIDLTPLPSQRPSTGADEGAWQMSVWDDRENVETHRQPVPVEVITDDRGYPSSILVEGDKLYISDVTDLWTIQDGWWTEQRTNSDFFEIIGFGATSTSILVIILTVPNGAATTVNYYGIRRTSLS